MHWEKSALERSTTSRHASCKYNFRQAREEGSLELAKTRKGKSVRDGCSVLPFFGGGWGVGGWFRSRVGGVQKSTLQNPLTNEFWQIFQAYGWLCVYSVSPSCMPWYSFRGSLFCLEIWQIWSLMTSRQKLSRMSTLQRTCK